jgi:hypothetical protein
MNSHDPGITEFERRTRQVLEESVARTSGSVRSRLTRARHRALEQGSGKSFRWRLSFALPAGGALAAAVLVVFVLWGQRPESPAAEDSHAALETLELLVDDEAFSLVEEGDGEFYEWAASQIEQAGEASG